MKKNILRLHQHYNLCYYSLGMSSWCVTTPMSSSANSLVISTQISNAAFAGASDTLKVGLVGCGGRGTGAAAQALAADPGTKLVAMGDAFMDKVEGSYKVLQKNAKNSCQVGR